MRGSERSPQWRQESAVAGRGGAGRQYGGDGRRWWQGGAGRDNGALEMRDGGQAQRRGGAGAEGTHTRPMECF